MLSHSTYVNSDCTCSIKRRKSSLLYEPIQFYFYSKTLSQNVVFPLNLQHFSQFNNFSACAYVVHSLHFYYLSSNTDFNFKYKFHFVFLHYFIWYSNLFYIQFNYKMHPLLLMFYMQKKNKEENRFRLLAA